MTDTLLITGGRGKVGRYTAEAARRKQATVYVGTRQPTIDIERRFDWQDSETFASFSGVQGTLLVAPPGAADALTVMRPGLEAALTKGVTRFVLVGASLIDKDGPFTGGVYRWLEENTPEWIVLRPSWFMQNFSEGQHAVTIREKNTIFSATGDGRVPFIDAEDIGRFAACALTEPISNGEYVITGPELLSYDAVAAEISAVLGREIKHCKLTESAMAARFVAAGLPGPFAQTLASMDDWIRKGAEDRLTNAVRQITGFEPQTFHRFAQSVTSSWVKQIV